MQRIFYYSATALVGLIFMVSAVLKLMPIEIFELTIIDITKIKWALAPYVSRFIISIEFILGSLLLLHIFSKKKIVVLASIGILLLFSIHLLFQIFTSGNSGNCMCMGVHVPMTPLQSLIKNGVMIIILTFVYFQHKSYVWKFEKVIAIGVAVIALLLSFAFIPISHSSTDVVLSDKIGKRLDFSRLYKENPKFSVDLDTGKHVILFASTTCPHCKIAVFKLALFKKEVNNLPISVVVNDVDSSIVSFLQENKAQNLPYAHLYDIDFVILSGMRIPSIYYINNGVVEKKVKYNSLQLDDIKFWLEN